MDSLGPSYRLTGGPGGSAALGFRPMPSGPRPERSERRLVRAAKRGSREAFEELFRMHWARAHRTAFLIVRDGAAAEDEEPELDANAVFAKLSSLKQKDPEPDDEDER